VVHLIQRLYCNANPAEAAPARLLAAVATQTTYDVIVGSPVANCDTISNNTVTSSVGGIITITDSWSVGAELGIELSKITVQNAVTKQIQYSQTININISPGQMGALIARIQYQQTSGTFKVGSGNEFPLMLNQPGSAEYLSRILPCNSTFAANVISSQDCDNVSAEIWLKGNARLIFSVAPIVVVSIFIYLVV